MVYRLFMFSLAAIAVLASAISFVFERVFVALSELVRQAFPVIVPHIPVATFEAPAKVIGLSEIRAFRDRLTAREPQRQTVSAVRAFA